MEEELVEGAGEQVYIPIIPDDPLVSTFVTQKPWSAVTAEKTLMTGLDSKLLPRIWTGALEESLRFHPVTEQLLDRNRIIRKPRKIPFTTRIKNRLAAFLRRQAIRLDGYDPEAYDEDY